MARGQHVALWITGVEHHPESDHRGVHWHGHHAGGIGVVCKRLDARQSGRDRCKTKLFYAVSIQIALIHRGDQTLRRRPGLLRAVGGVLNDRLHLRLGLELQL